jgi:uncharacterized membrane protein HdeD (DUF308 family)
MSSFELESTEVIRGAARFWWLFLLTGIAWIVVSLILFRFDYTSVAAVSILFGIVALFFGANEFVGLGAMTTGWKLVHIGLGILFIIAGIIALARPYDTFATLAAIIGFFLVIKGVFDIVVSFVTKDDIPIWWLQLVIGIVEVLLGFWAAGNFRGSAFLLVVFVAASCLARGITEIILAFKLHGLKKTLGGGGPPPAPAV